MQLFLCKNERNFKEIVASLDRRKKLVLFGAGRVGMHVLLQLEKEGIAVDYFVDNDWSKVGTTIYDDVPVISSVDLIDLADKGEVDVLITMRNIAVLYPQLLHPRFFAVTENIKGLFNGEWPDFYKEEIDSLGRVVLQRIEVYAALECNLNCAYCSHLSTHVKGIVPSDSLKEWFKTWSLKIQPNNFDILGGEPLLNPKLDEIVYAAREYWPETRLRLITNGLLLHKASDSLVHALRQAHASVEISRHFDNPRLDGTIQRGIVKLKNGGVDVHVRNSIGIWRKSYRGAESKGAISPCGSDPNKAYEVCVAKNCPCLHDNRLIFCSPVMALKIAKDQGALNEEWRFLDEAEFLTRECTAMKIIRHLNAGPVPVCRMCPERTEIVFPQRISALPEK